MYRTALAGLVVLAALAAQASSAPVTPDDRCVVWNPTGQRLETACTAWGRLNHLLHGGLAAAARPASDLEG